MKIITWNVHGAQNDSAVWGVLLNLHPDIVLLQEVGAFPSQLADTFDIVSRPAIYKTGKPRRFSTAVLVRGKILEEVALSPEFAWVNHELEFFKGNLISCRVQPKDHQPLIAVSVYSPAWAVGRERLKEVDVSQVKTKINPDVWVTDIL
jgi:exonuclease III